MMHFLSGNCGPMSRTQLLRQARSSPRFFDDWEYVWIVFIVFQTVERRRSQVSFKEKPNATIELDEPKPQCARLLLFPTSSTKAPADLICDLDLYVQFLCPIPNQSWVFLKHATCNHNIEPLFKQVIGLLATRDGTHGAHCDSVTELRFDGFGEGLE